MDTTSCVKQRRLNLKVDMVLTKIVSAKALYHCNDPIWMIFNPSGLVEVHGHWHSSRLHNSSNKIAMASHDFSEPHLNNIPVLGHTPGPSPFK